jgi:hypothetical protein
MNTRHSLIKPPIANNIWRKRIVVGTDVVIARSICFLVKFQKMKSAIQVTIVAFFVIRHLQTFVASYCTKLYVLIYVVVFAVVAVVAFAFDQCSAVKMDGLSSNRFASGTSGTDSRVVLQLHVAFEHRGTPFLSVEQLQLLLITNYVRRREREIKRQDGFYSLVSLSL